MRALEGAPKPPASTASKKSQIGLDWFSFFLADVQTGFGPFLAVYLTSEKWTNADIGYVLSAGGIVALAGQVPGGAIIDATRRERFFAAISMLGIGLSALVIALWPQFWAVLLAQVVHAGASVIVGPALAAISLGLVGHGLIGQRLGRNARFASIGTVIAAALMGACGHYFSSKSVFYVTAATALPAFIALHMVSPKEFWREPQQPGQNTVYHPLDAFRELEGHRPLLVLAACVGLFHLSNAALMPLVANVITLRSSDGATVLVALCIIIPQIVVALTSTWIGRFGDAHGRRPFLLLGFGVLPVRAALLASSSDPVVLLAIQALDGASGAALGVLVSGAVADITKETGNFNLALGLIGTAMGIGATVSTAASGLITDHFGSAVAFMTLSLIGLVAFVLFATAMPETNKPQGGQ